MDFRTQVEKPKSKKDIRYSDHLLLLGSCFAENIGTLLSNNKFDCDINPFGILYNPMSIAEALKQILEAKVYNMDDLFEANGLWHSWMHHSNFSSNISADDCLAQINGRLKIATNRFKETDWLIMTWGTAWAYWHENKIVGNCHKCPDALFVRELLSVETIVEEWKSLLVQMKEMNPELKVLFTVSPIRHAKDGFHGNQLSKATLLLAIDQLCRSNDFCFYFPSYEIQLDELRDYRFYADDMLHPSKLAVDYLWECFSASFFSADTQLLMKEFIEIQKALQHRPFRPESEAYRRFLNQIMLKIMRLKENFPYIDTQKELEICHTLLKK